MAFSLNSVNCSLEPIKIIFESDSINSLGPGFSLVLPLLSMIPITSNPYFSRILESETVFPFIELKV